MKSICKITIKSERRNNFGTGFFLNYSDSLNLQFFDINKSSNNELNIEKSSENTIKGVLFMNPNIKHEINDNNTITLFCTYIQEGIEVFLENEQIKMTKDNYEWKIDYNFVKG